LSLHFHLSFIHSHPGDLVFVHGDQIFGRHTLDRRPICLSGHFHPLPRPLLQLLERGPQGEIKLYHGRGIGVRRGLHLQPCLAKNLYPQEVSEGQDAQAVVIGVDLIARIH
jgi:hypothetical protein